MTMRHLRTVLRVAIVLLLCFSLCCYYQTITSLCVSIYNVEKLSSTSSIEQQTDSVPSTADDDCKFANLTMLDEPRPITALSSFPGSGNTWVRHLLQQATGETLRLTPSLPENCRLHLSLVCFIVQGIGTGSIYCDAVLLSNGFPFECIHRPDRLLVTKAHKGFPEAWERKAAIVIIRNPYDALLSWFNFDMSGKNHTGTANYSQFRTEWPKFPKARMKMWEFIYMFYSVEFEGPVLLVVYEKLKQNVMQELTRMLTFLNQTVQQDRMACIQRDISGQHYRAKVFGLKPNELYPAHLTKYINDIISRVALSVKARHGVDISMYKR